MFTRRISILVGHFGSGKSEIAVNYSMRLARDGLPVSLIDLDVIKPYFRSRSARDQLAAAGVELVAPTGDSFYADLPIMLPRVRGLCRQHDRRVVMDVGGDDAGARVIGSLDDVLDPDEIEVAAVLNFNRPFTADPDQAVAMIRGIEGNARMRVTGVIANTHLMQFTKPETVRSGYENACECARRLSVKVLAVCVPSVLEGEFSGDEFESKLFPISRVIRTTFAADTDSAGGDSGVPEQPPAPGFAPALEGRYGVRKVGPLFVPAAMPDEEG